MVSIKPNRHATFVILNKIALCNLIENLLRIHQNHKMNRKALEKRLHTQIPVSEFMQVEVIRLDDDVELQCELAPNHNHLGTAFGGSLSALMILAAYCQLFRLIHENGHVVLKSTSMQFLLPVKEKLHAICKSPSKKDIQNFTNTFEKKKKARLNLESQIILSDGRVACTLTGEFVAVG